VASCLPQDIVIIHIITIKMSSNYVYPVEDTSSNSLPTPKPILDIITHGNCADGWGAAFLFYKTYRWDHEVRVHPVAPSNEATWPSVEAVRGHKLLFVDVTCGARMADYAAAAASVRIVDHHPAAKAHLGLAGDAGCFAEDCCATRLAWTLTYPGFPEPAWVTYINQIDMWQDVTEQTLAFREMVTPIARLAVTNSPAEALMAMEELVQRMEDPEEECAIYLEGIELYRDKIAALEALLAVCPQFHGTIDEPLQVKWNLPKAWIGKTIFVANTSKNFIGTAIMDTTVLSQHVFDLNPGTTIFVNYHVVTWNYKGKPFCKYVYHARAKGVDLTECAALDGHASAAGGQFQPPKPMDCPFVI